MTAIGARSRAGRSRTYAPLDRGCDPGLRQRRTVEAGSRLPAGDSDDPFHGRLRRRRRAASIPRCSRPASASGRSGAARARGRARHTLRVGARRSRSRGARASQLVRARAATASRRTAERWLASAPPPLCHHADHGWGPRQRHRPAAPGSRHRFRAGALAVALFSRLQRCR